MTDGGMCRCYAGGMATAAELRAEGERPLSAEELKIIAAWEEMEREGTASAAALAQRFGRSKRGIQDLIRRARAKPAACPTS